MANQNTQHNESTRPGSPGSSPEKTDQSKTGGQRTEQRTQGQRADRKRDSEEFNRSSSKETGSGGRETSEDEDMGEDLNH